MANNQVSKKSRKAGRNAAACKAYRDSNRRERNKIVKLKKHLTRFPGDAGARDAIKRCEAAIRGY